MSGFDQHIDGVGLADVVRDLQRRVLALEKRQEEAPAALEVVHVHPTAVEVLEVISDQLGRIEVQGHRIAQRLER